MGVVTLLVTVTLLIVNIIYRLRKKEENRIVHPSTIFYMLWTFILFLSVLNLYGLYKPSNEAYFLILLMNVLFGIGNFIGEKIKWNKENEKDEKNEKEKFWSFSTIVICIISVIYIILLLIDCYIVITNYTSGVPMWKIRRWNMEPFDTADNPLLNRRTIIEEAFRNIIIIPFELILTPIAAYYFFNKSEKKKYLYLTFSIIILFLSSVAGGGGRLGYIYYFGTYLLSYIYMMKNNMNISEEKKKIYKKVIYTLLVVGVIVVIAFTAIRTDMSFFKQVYKYFALPPTLLSTWLPQIKEFDHTYGMLTFFGIHSYVFRGLKAVNMGFLVPEVYNNAYNYLLKAEDFVQSGMGVANAFVTPIYYFYIDGGYPFVCIASLLFGILISTVYKRICNEIDARNFVLYILSVYGVFLTFIRIQTCIPGFIIAIILTFLILKREKTNE